MKKLLIIATKSGGMFHDIMHADHKEWFCTSDPVGKKLGSGGGTAWLLNACREEEDKDAALGDWLAREKRILAACRGTEPPSAGLCAVGQGTDADSGVPLGTRTAHHTGLAVAAAAAV